MTLSLSDRIGNNAHAVAVASRLHAAANAAVHSVGFAPGTGNTDRKHPQTALRTDEAASSARVGGASRECARRPGPDVELSRSSGSEPGLCCPDAGTGRQRSTGHSGGRGGRLIRRSCRIWTFSCPVRKSSLPMFPAASTFASEQHSFLFFETCLPLRERPPFAY